MKNNDKEDDSEEDSSKWDFKMLAAAFAKQGHNFQKVMTEIKSIVLKTLISVETQITSQVMKNPTTRANCFELYGFDVMIDNNMKPWVLEVNVLPSLSSSSVFDKRIKTMLVCDALTIVGLKGYDKLEFKDRDIADQYLQPF